ncbi:ABC transporter substrate-binding protein [Myxococcota bacterium]
MRNRPLTRNRKAKAVAWLAVALGAASCGSGESTGSTTEDITKDSQGQTIHYASYIGQEPGHAHALQSILSVYQSRHPEDRVTYTEINPATVPADIAGLIAAGTPPDVFEMPAPLIPFFLAANGPSSLHPLNDFLASPSQADIGLNLYPEFVANTTINGQIYGLPSAVVCTNVVYYNKRVFADNHLNPPTTIAEFRTVCDKLKAAGVNPIGLFGASFLLQDLMAAVMGIDAYHSYMTGGEPDERLLRNAIDLFEEVVDNYVDPSALQAMLVSPMDQVTAFMAGRNAMYFSADWTSQTLEELGWTSGIDFGIAFAPENEGLFGYSLQALSILATTPNLQGALNFLDSVLSLETQSQLPMTHPRMDVDTSVFNSEKRAIMQGLIQAKHRVPINLALRWEAPIFAFVQSTPHNKEALLQVLLSTR